MILCARYFLKISQQRFASSIQIQDFVKNDRFIRLKGGLESLVGATEINRDDILKLSLGQISPVDGKLIEAAALFDVAVLNGEPMPRQFEVEMEITAGAKLLSQQAFVRVTRAPDETRLADLLRTLREGSWKKSNFLSLTDRCAQWLILTVFGIAVLFFAFYFRFDPEEAFNRSLALIVLACPCALAFGTPLALSLGLRKAQALGILAKSSDVFERILKSKRSSSTKPEPSRKST